MGDQFLSFLVDLQSVGVVDFFSFLQFFFSILMTPFCWGEGSMPCGDGEYALFISGTE